MKDPMEYLMNHACPSIRLRLRREVLGNLESEEEATLTEEILRDALVRKYIALIDADGWIPNDMHSPEGVETAVRVLTEKGLDKSHPTVAGMLAQLEQRSDSFDLGCLFRVGKFLDELNLGGSQTIRAVIFAYANEENKDFVREEIRKALDAFQAVTNVEAMEQITEEYRGRLVFKKGVVWPGIYHLRLLAFTESWRTPDEYRMLRDAVQRLVDLSPIPYVNGLYRSQLISQGSFAMHHFRADFDEFKAKDWMRWFHRMELLSRIGVIPGVPEIRRQYDVLLRMLENGSGVFSKKHAHAYFTNWDTYGGLALEEDWKTKERYLCDLCFRSLLIRHFSQTSFEYFKNSEL